jgi:uncharacterized protein YjbJ (UPF0337 family)
MNLPRPLATRRYQVIKKDDCDEGCAIGNTASRDTDKRTLDMDWNIVEGNWKQFKGKVKAQWGKLTDDHLDVIAGNRDQLAGKIQETYGITKDETEKQIKDFEELNKH